MDEKESVKMGRPTTYQDIYVTMADKYLDTCQDTEREFHKTRGDKSDSYDRIIDVKLPTIEGFAIFLGHHKDSLYDWAKKYPDFSDSLKKITQLQKEKLLMKGLSGDYNPVIAKLILSSNHDMNDRTETDITTKGESINPDKKALIRGLLDQMK